MQKKIKDFIEVFNNKTKNKDILVISHFDADGITSAAIFGKCLKKLDKRFSFKIVKGLEREFIEKLPKSKVLVFLDLASGSLNELSELKNEIFIIDHHQIKKEFKLPENMHIFNPELWDREKMSGSCNTYIISKELSGLDVQSANLAIIGMVGDIMEKEIGPIANTILKDSNATIKKGLLLYPSTRPLNKALEYCSNPLIPGVTGNPTGASELLREIGIEFTQKGYKSLMELNEDEMQKLVTAVTLRIASTEKIAEFIGNIFLVKFYNQLEDARELSALINACSRMDHSEIALLFCMGNKNARKEADRIYIRYKQNLVQALNYVSSNPDLPKIQGKQYVIINARDNIKDTIIGTVASILSMSTMYKEGTIIVTMAYNEDKIKVSSRISGRSKNPNSRSLKEIMDEITGIIGGESGGHQFAAGCLISKEQEEAFITLVKKKLDIELVKI